MAHKTNYTAIGIFVIGGFVLALSAIAVFGSGALLKETIKYVVFFDGSVDGLGPGSAVKFRGATVGEVSDVTVKINEDSTNIIIPVTIEVDPQRIHGMKPAGSQTVPEMQQNILKLGLRAQLGYESFVTGQRMIALDFKPEVAPRLIGVDPSLPEIPSIPTAFDELSERFKNLPLEKIGGNLDALLLKLNERVGSDEVTAAINSFTEAMDEVKSLAQSIEKQVGPLSDDARKVLTQDIQGISQKISETLDVLEELVAGGGTTSLGIGSALREVTLAARELRQFTEYLNRHPEAVIKGKQ